MKTNKDLIIEPNAAIEGRKYSEEKPWSCNVVAVRMENMFHVSDIALPVFILR